MVEITEKHEKEKEKIQQMKKEIKTKVIKNNDKIQQQNKSSQATPVSQQLFILEG
jgi:hypothetical protein